jgi:predicted metal-binding membrane protein
MLLMFAFGPAALVWMIALTGIMAVEIRARAGREIALIVGIALLAIAGARLLGVLPGSVLGFA